MQGQICSNCQFGLEEPRGTVFARDRGPGWGTCRRNAPTVVVIQSPERTAFSQAAFPRVAEGDWCGEYAIKGERMGGYRGLE